MTVGPDILICSNGEFTIADDVDRLQREGAENDSAIPPGLLSSSCLYLDLYPWIRQFDYPCCVGGHNV